MLILILLFSIAAANSLGQNAFDVRSGPDETLPKSLKTKSTKTNGNEKVDFSKKKWKEKRTKTNR